MFMLTQFTQTLKSLPQVLKIGEQKELSLELKTKDNADLAGHFQQLDQPKDATKSKPEIWFPFLNKI